MLDGDEEIKDVIDITTDYLKVHDRLANNRKESYQYLISALEDKGSTDCD